MTCPQFKENEIRNSVKVMLRARVLCMLEDYGFARPRRLEMGYDLASNKIVVGLEYGDTRISFKLEPDDYCQSTMNTLAESLAQDNRIPIAAPL